MQKINKKKVLSSLLWRFAERCGAQGVSLIVSIVLARLLLPEDYGIVALVTVFTTILQVFVDSGLGNALVQKKDADDLDFSTVFYTNVCFCTVLYFFVFFAAPYIAAFYDDFAMTPYIRVLSLTVLISGVKNVQQAYVSCNMLFKKFFFATLGGTVTAGVAGVIMALLGFGVWALVAQQVINVTIDTIILWITVKWRPHLKFSFERLKELFSFGWKLLASSLIDTVYNDLRQLIIGKLYSSSDLAYYNQGKKFPYVIVTNINASIDSVLLPVMSKVQDDRNRVKAMTRRAIKTSSFFMWPAMIGLAVCAKPLVSVILTDKWLPCVPFMQLFCISYAFYPIHTANLNAIKALGRSDVFLKLEIVKKIVGMVSILITMPFGVLAIAGGMFVTTPISALINAFPNRSLLNYSYREQIVDLLPYMLLSAFMGTCIYPIQHISTNNILVLLVQIVVGITIYLIGAKVLRFEVVDEVFKILKDLKKIVKSNESKYPVLKGTKGDQK